MPRNSARLLASLKSRVDSKNSCDEGPPFRGFANTSVNSANIAIHCSWSIRRVGPDIFAVSNIVPNAAERYGPEVRAAQSPSFRHPNRGHTSTGAGQNLFHHNVKAKDAGDKENTMLTMLSLPCAIGYSFQSARMNNMSKHASPALQVALAYHEASRNGWQRSAETRFSTRQGAILSTVSV